jgi:hypothetical protein
MLYGPFRLVDGGIMDKAYESIIDVINEKTDGKGNDVTVDYYEAARIAYTDREYVRKYIDQELNVRPH